MTPCQTGLLPQAIKSLPNFLKQHLNCVLSSSH